MTAFDSSSTTGNVAFWTLASTSQGPWDKYASIDTTTKLHRPLLYLTKNRHTTNRGNQCFTRLKNALEIYETARWSNPKQQTRVITALASKPFPNPFCVKRNHFIYWKLIKRGPACCPRLRVIVQNPQLHLGTGVGVGWGECTSNFSTKHITVDWKEMEFSAFF